MPGQSENIGILETDISGMNLSPPPSPSTKMEVNSASVNKKTLTEEGANESKENEVKLKVMATPRRPCSTFLGRIQSSPCIIDSSVSPSSLYDVMRNSPGQDPTASSMSFEPVLPPPPPELIISSPRTNSTSHFGQMVTNILTPVTRNTKTDRFSFRNTANESDERNQDFFLSTNMDKSKNRGMVISPDERLNSPYPSDSTTSGSPSGKQSRKNVLSALSLPETSSMSSFQNVMSPGGMKFIRPRSNSNVVPNINRRHLISTNTSTIVEDDNTEKIDCIENNNEDTIMECTDNTIANDQLPSVSLKFKSMQQTHLELVPPNTPTETDKQSDGQSKAEFSTVPKALPLDRNCHSFTGPSEYRRRFLVDNSSAIMDYEEDEPTLAGIDFKQYTPKRHTSLGSIGGMEAGDELEGIFLHSSPRTNHKFDSQINRDMCTSEGVKAIGERRGEAASDVLASPVPLDERSLSIPSLRLASRINSDLYGSIASFTASYTDDLNSICTEDDSYLNDKGAWFVDDDGGSFGITPAAAIVTDKKGQVPFASGADTLKSDELSLSSHEGDRFLRNTGYEPYDFCEETGVVTKIEGNINDTICSSYQMKMMGDDAPTVAAIIHPSNEISGHKHKRQQSHKKSKLSKSHDTNQLSPKEEQKAFEWLRTVEVERDNEFVAEAASSKFLTGKKGRHYFPTKNQAAVPTAIKRSVTELAPSAVFVPKEMSPL